MKAHSSYFQQKNTKRGLALSTAMAISIVLAILVALLVSMATLNITTTQDTVYQREAYIQAKSAIAFAESYYSLHADQIPGKGGTYGEALMVFETNTVADGAKVYITKTDASTYASGFSATAVQDLKEDAPDTYVEIVNTGSTLIATAFCKYGENDAYELSKEFDMVDSGTVRGNTFTGRILYTPTSDTRYLRIHVRTSEAFYYEPYLYVWGSARNGNEAQKNGKSSLINKMAGNSDFPNIKFSGEWDGDNGPTGAMEYEGNGWYVYEIEIGTELDIEYVNAIVTRKGALRKDSKTAQSWEFFGIPVPKATGVENGADVYITLNKDHLLDAQNDGPGTTKDTLTYWFESEHGANVDSFAQYSGSWYTVYTKKDTATLHYRKAGTYTADHGKSIGLESIGFLYEGYGWWRDTTNDLGASVNINGTDYAYFSSKSSIISQNQYGKELVVETFVCDDGTNTEVYGTEADANDWFVNVAGDADADDYVTINVKANEQPVDKAVKTTITYTSEIIKGVTPPTPVGPVSTDVDSSDTDSELVSTDISYNSEDDEPEVAPVANKTTDNDKLNVQKTAATAADVQTSGDGGIGYSIAGSFNNWGLGDGTETRYENLDDMDHVGGYNYSITYTDVPAGEHSFKVIEKMSDSGAVEWTNHSWGDSTSGDPNGNYIINLDRTADVTINFEYQYNTISVSWTTDDDIGSGKTYSVIGWLNDWGRLGGAGDHYYENLNDMEDIGGGSYKYTVPTLVSGGQSYTFKICEKLADSGTLEANGGWDKAWGGSGATTDADGNYVLDLTGSPGEQFTVEITFNENSHTVSAVATMVEIVDESFYVVGTFNNWAEHSYDNATSYPLNFVGVDTAGNAIYKCEIGLRSPSDPNEEIKVISSRSELTTPDAEGKTIDFNQSWGRADDSGVSLGSDKTAFDYSIPEPSYVEITFTLNSVDRSKSKITYAYTPLRDYDDTVTLKAVGFHNNRVENVNTDPHTFTDFTTPWDQVYVTYNSPTQGFNCEPVTMSTGSDVVWAYVPSDSTTIYFSNRDMDDRTSPGYEYTVDISAAEFATITNPIFFPITTVPADSNGTLWSLGDNALYMSYMYTVDTDGETNAEMVYTGSSQTNYYDVPMVKLLEMLVDGGGKKNYAFSAYPYPSYDIAYGSGSDGKLSFTSDYHRGTVEYQGEVYYFVPVSYEYSYMIVNDAINDGVATKSGILFENHFALMSDVNPAGSLPVNMDNRGGGVFTSDGVYYNGGTSPHSYSGYTPSWYTYKIHATTSYIIKDITGVTSTSTKIIDSNSNSTAVVKAADCYNQPLYIYSDGGDAKVYTYNTDIGKVDTSSDGKVSVYFNKPSSWSNDVYCYAYGIGPSTDTSVHIDSTNADNTYYQFTFNSGEYAYFVFYDHGEISDATQLDTTSKKTGVLYLTGEENENREYAILADGEGATQFSYFLHPKTAALYAFHEARSAYNESKVFVKYSYNASTKTYEGVGDMTAMSEIEAKMNDAENYANNGDGGRWTASRAASYADLAAAAREFTDAISEARIYIAEENPGNPSLTAEQKKYIFPEREYRDSILSYTERWVSYLKIAYNDAMNAYSNTDLQNADSLRALAANIYAITSYPESELSPDAVQIILDDQADEEGNGQWGQNGINLYNKPAGSTTWINTGYPVQITDQTDFYAFVFKLTLDGEFCILEDGKTEPEPGVDETFTLTAGTHYIFSTATRHIEEDDTQTPTMITMTEIEEGGTYAMWAVHDTSDIDEEIEIYFNYDTTVKYGSGVSAKSYVIRAGIYTISKSTYANFSTDFVHSGKYGINLFTDGAMAFFKDPARYGMSKATTTGYTDWTTNLPSDGNNKDIMTSNITISGEASAISTTNRRVNFRYNCTQGSDTLTLANNVHLEAGVVTMAANNIELNGNDFEIFAKTIIFYTDTEVTKSDGTTYTILHGTYIFNNKSGSSTKAEIMLSDSDWTKNYTLVDELDSQLRGGKFVGN